MILDPRDTKRFYQIWWSLLTFVNAQRKIVKNFATPPVARSVKAEPAAKIRDALWKDNSLREQFIAENPMALPPQDLDLVASWKNRVEGNFYVLKHLKKYSVFLGESPNQSAYGVLGLVSPIADIVPPYLPLYVRTVLLPFEGKIIYDGLISSYSLYFGPGIRADMKIWLRDAEEREGILTALPALVMAGGDIGERNAKIMADFRKALIKSGLSLSKVEEHARNIENFADYLLKRDPPIMLIDLRAKDMEDYVRLLTLDESKGAIKSFKRFSRFLWDTARSDPDTLGDLEDFIKSYRRKTQ